MFWPDKYMVTPVCGSSCKEVGHQNIPTSLKIEMAPEILVRIPSVRFRENSHFDSMITL
jgi:hypothetical protein